MPPLLLIRLVVAAVWIYEGLWCKILGGARGQPGIVAAVPGLGPDGARWFLPALGYAECLLGAWLLSGWQPWWAALLSTLALAAMNTVGLTYARQQIHDPAGMVLKNLVLVVLTWVAAALRP